MHQHQHTFLNMASWTSSCIYCPMPIIPFQLSPYITPSLCQNSSAPNSTSPGSTVHIVSSLSLSKSNWTTILSSNENTPHLKNPATPNGTQCHPSYPPSIGYRDSNTICKTYTWFLDWRTIANLKTSNKDELSIFIFYLSFLLANLTFNILLLVNVSGFGS